VDAVYSDHVHQNPGTHLTGGIADDALCQEHWWQLVSIPLHAYDVPSGTIGKRFCKKVAEEPGGIRSVFHIVVLQHDAEISNRPVMSAN
jgi:hypothetical protein